MPRPVVPIRRVAAPLLARPVERAVRRQDQRRIVGEAQRLGRNRQPLAAHRLDLGEQRPGIDDDAAADDRQLAGPHDPRRQQAQLVLDIADDERMPGIVAALEAHDDIGALRQPIDDFSLPFVAPLGADDGDIGHLKLLLRRPSESTGRTSPPSSTWPQPSRRASSCQSEAGCSAATVIHPSSRSARARARSASNGTNKRRRGVRLRQCAQDRVGVQREPGRRLGRGRVAGLVATAAPQLAKRPTHRIDTREKREADAGVVLEAAVLDRIYRHLDLRDRGIEPIEHRAETVALDARPRGQIEPVERDPGWFGETGGRDQGGKQFARLAGQTGDRGNILAIERGAQRGPALAGNAVSLGNRRHQGRQCDVHRQMRHADFGQGLAGHRDRLDIGRRTGGADQLGARPARSGARAASATP